MDDDTSAAPETDRPLSVHEALALALSDVGAIGKDGKNTQQNFAYRSIEAIKAEVKAALARHGVVLLPRVLSSERWQTERGKTGQKALWDHVALEIEYTFVGPDGTERVASAMGEGLDNGDKAYAKAATFSFKTLLTTVFLIADRDEQDPDASSPPEQLAAPPPWETLGWTSVEEYDDQHQTYREVGKGLTTEQQRTLKDTFPEWPMTPGQIANAWEAIEAMTAADEPQEIVAVDAQAGGGGE